MRLGIVDILQKQRFSVPIWLCILFGTLALLPSCDTPDSVAPFKDQTFIKLFGGNGSEVGRDLVAVPQDEGFVLVGSTSSVEPQDGTDVYVVRTDKSGNIIWEQSFDGNGGDDVGSSVVLDGENIYVCGEVSQRSGFLNLRRDVVVYNLTLSNGALVNERVYGDSLRDEFGTDIIKLGGGGFFISATMWHPDTAKYFLIETDPNLDTIQFRSRYIGTNNVVNTSTRSEENQIDPNNPFVCFGTTFRPNVVPTNSSFWFHVFTYKSNSNQPGIVEHYGSETQNEYCTDIERTSDGGYILSGFREVGNVNTEMVVKIDANLREVWAEPKVYPNEFNRSVGDCGIMQTSDGGYVITSTIQLPDPRNEEISLLRLDAEGNEMWRQTFGSDENDAGSNVIELDDGSFAVIGTIGFDINPSSSTKMGLIKVNPQGELVPIN